MKNIIKSGFGIALAMLMMLVACDPNEFDKSELNVGTAPTADEMSFTVTQGEDAFHYKLENLTNVSGVATVKWDFGNGSSGEGNNVIAYYPLPGDYEITLTISATDGTSGVKTMSLEQTETDYAFLDSPVLTMISGGASVTEGKTWVVDSLASAHYGIGPASGNWPEWWAASPLQKTGSGSYDDEFTFKMVDFIFDYVNNGNSYAKDYRLDDPNYSNPVEVDGTDAKVDFTPAAANWSFSETDGTYYITLSSDKPSFFGFDYGAVNNEYRIESITETNITLSCIGGDGNRWYNGLVLKGYVKPTVTFNVDVQATGEENTWAVSLTDLVIPDGLFVNSFSVDFGDGSEVMESDDATASLENTYMRKGTYPISVTVKASNEDLASTSSITVDNHHSAYVPFLLDMMVMYVDNSEVELSPILGQDCGVNLVDNPDRIYPNKGAKVLHYSKENQQWANAYMQLPAGYRFDIGNNSVFKIMVFGKAGQEVLLKLENTDKGGNAWQTGTYDVIYTIQEDDTWEVAEFDFAGVAAGYDWTGDQFTSDVTTDTRFSQDFYNVVRIMLNPGNGDGAHEFYFDDLAGPHVEGVKSGRSN
ncbi:PKD domain-containing protein [Marinifilum sp. N1E240]|uniref:PKD domain-containing protein n=1 Tax=Marinifilum sp. N1E240 TaxID=2608082 RepID=UPI00128BE80A|nr:PKD domain-containing protein [Marinifilum sp. N1E240]MPQ46691.1 PKD domain-containing protein [Marinifilum sp. N1E240]